VRQNFLTWLTLEKGYPVSLLRVESNLMLGNSNWRFDAVFFRKDGKPAVIIECKAPDVPVGPESFEQIARYNEMLKQIINGNKRGKALLLQNGLQYSLMGLSS
jgi:phage portal protein BeeE